ncbi:SPOR domain-containing protein [Sanguibacter hominis ATCC BAA-789]|uniref:SPOR domain-containing protein n=1 Tax=Sanguibacter hominis ATCC BAA-789 TaxID=1312740 RepID=A0A9X5IQX0_9MICO|nr:SPOR domain-containing protein [Sanguibacter hominis ATCC BAA-789]
MVADDGEYYFDTATGQVTQGKQGAWSTRMGPYKTREEAEHALDKARAASDAWDAEDRREAAERDGDA